jgi:hypothetical protein
MDNQEKAYDLARRISAYDGLQLYRLTANIEKLLSAGYTIELHGPGEGCTILLDDEPVDISRFGPEIYKVAAELDKLTNADSRTVRAATARHTQGPWTITKPVPGDKEISIEAEGRILCTVDRDDCDQDVAKADALLIKECPEMWRVIVGLVGEADLGEVDLEDEQRAYLDAGRSIIDRITGGAK